MSVRVAAASGFATGLLMAGLLGACGDERCRPCPTARTLSIASGVYDTYRGVPQGSADGGIDLSYSLTVSSDRAQVTERYTMDARPVTLQYDVVAVETIDVYRF